jgi:tRNA threonylcarbamoyladenosine biosynthesis protein TsaB
LILSIETSTKAFSISIFQETEIANLELLYDVTHSQNIVSATKFLLESVNKSVNDVKQIYAGIGPGSFTGIRIGLSFANTMCQVLGIPLTGIASLDLLAFKKRNCYNPAIAFIRSRRQEVYTACYREGKRATGYLVLNREGLLGFIKENDPEYLISSENDYRSIISQDDIDNSIEKYFTYPSARDAFLLVEEYGLKPEKRFLKPMYIRDF